MWVFCVFCFLGIAGSCWLSQHPFMHAYHGGICCTPIICKYHIWPHHLETAQTDSQLGCNIGMWCAHQHLCWHALQKLLANILSPPIDSMLHRFLLVKEVAAIAQDHCNTSRIEITAANGLCRTKSRKTPMSQGNRLACAALLSEDVCLAVQRTDKH